jgi:hypothetical protein
MIALVWFVLAVLISPFKSKSRLEAENAALRHQLAQVEGEGPAYEQRPVVLRPALSLVPIDLQVFTIIRPETLVRWHRAGFCHYWRWKSQRRGGRPPIDAELLG